MLLSDNTLIRIIINHYFDCQFPFYANKSPLHLTHWTFNVEKKKPTYDLCLFSGSGLYLFIISQISAVCTDGYSVRLRRKTFRIQSWRSWKETKCSSCPRPCRRLHTQVCPAKNWESAAGQTCGDVGFKRWFRSLQTLYHSRQTRDICEIQNIHFRVVLESCVQCWGQVRGWETAKSSNILPVPEAKKIRTSYHIFVTWLVIC